MDAWVRKTATICIAKLYDINPELVEDQAHALLFITFWHALLALPSSCSIRCDLKVGFL